MLLTPNVTINPVGLDTNIGIGSTAQAIAIINTLGQLASIRYSFAVLDTLQLQL